MAILARLQTYRMRALTTISSHKVLMCPSVTAIATTWQQTNKPSSLTSCFGRIIISLLAIQKSTGNTPGTTYPKSNCAKPWTHKLWDSRNVESNVNRDTTSTSTHKSRRYWPSPQAMDIKSSGKPSPMGSAAQSSSSSMHFVNPSFCEVSYDTFHLNPKYPRLTHDSFLQLEMIR